MARNFIAASSQSLTSASSPVSGMPFTVACWVRPVAQTAAAIRELIQLRDAAAHTYFFSLATTGGVTAGLFDGTVNDSTAVTSALVTAGAWNHAVAVYAGTSSRSAYLNGGNKVTSVVATSAVTPNEVDVGMYAGIQFMNGDIAEGAIWSIALTDTEIASLALGVSPLLIRPTSLVSYWPLVGVESPERDRMVAKIDLALTNAPAQATHPPMFRRSGQR